MKTIAFVTYQKAPSFTPDDKVAADELTRRGYQVTAQAWNQPADWNSYDVIIVRSTWDYYHHPAEFRNWLDTIEKTNATILNPLPIVRQNMHKSYLHEMELKGIPVPGMLVYPNGEKVDLAAALQSRQWDRAVIKPAISAGGTDTWLTMPETRAEDEQRMNVLLQSKDMIIQEFVPEVMEDGEVSLVFFNGRYSHAVRKRPQPSEFRINTQYQGIIEPAVIDDEHIEAAAQYLEMTKTDTLYARVDGIVQDNHFRLMEVEMIEPALFFGYHPDAAKRFADALVERL